MDNLEVIKKAIDVEIKNKYINIRGRKQFFSDFMMSHIRRFMKDSEIPERWKVVLGHFRFYSTSSYIERKNAVEFFITVLKQELTFEKEKGEKKSLNPFSSVTYVKGVGPKIAAMLNKLGIFTASDLMFYFPRKHIDYSKRTKIRDLEEGQTTTVFGYIRLVENFISKKGIGVVKVKIADDSGSLVLNFFFAKSSKYTIARIKRQFPLNSAIIVSGTAKINSYDGRYTLENTTYSIMSEEFGETKQNLNIARIVPIYSLSEGVNPKVLRGAIYNAIRLYKDTIVNVVPEYIRQKYHLMDKKEAVEQIHFPNDNDSLEQARYTLIFEELFLIQLRLALVRQKNKTEHKSLPLKIAQDGLVMKFIKSLPFELTSAQKRAVNEILNDMNSTEPMQRLLQGDVGSGKTVVACIMLLAAIENGYQAALMAPTEILAQQHYNNMTNWLTPLGLSVGLFLGSLRKKQREEFEMGLRNSQIDIAVGTHALIQDKVEFANLGAIVIDEQHRFGVKQRLDLRKKAQNPQTLTMTATPIPRTLAITMNGDLDLTIIDELPKGRKPVITKMGMGRKEIYQLIKSQIDMGHQAYIVYPLIEESETLSAKAATQQAQKLQQTVFKDYRVGLLHGKLKNSEKDEVMQKFKNREYDILVATTVVEVGVDVPNATVIVIENAERFGLSQLHQLRGRVGRCELQSYCILTSNSKTEDTKARLSVMTQTNDGFVIAEKDLQIRGPGEFLGVRQSGLPDMMISDIVRDAKILELARGCAIEFVKNNDVEDFPYLKNLSNLTLDGTLILGS